MIKRGLVDTLVMITIVAASKANAKSWFGTEFVVLQKVYDDCYDSNDFTGCLKGKALVALNKAAEQESITLFDGVLLEKQNSTSVEDAPPIMDERSLNELTGIDKELMSTLNSFLRSHVLKLDLSEGRGKKEKKFHKYALAALFTAMGIAAPLGLKALAIISGKALVISKVALTIAGIIALKKIYSSDSHEETSFQVHTGNEHNRRTYVLRPVKSPVSNTQKPTTMDPYRYYSNNNYEYSSYQ